ncbi:MAG TPA: chemotaxis protein CheA [Hyphomonadaceae bacterium]|jgi:two-component system chemotaxis sensor kinase CheA|nr:chemotaxis protein CheA [Hyphomonadaceae bacterium]
MDALEQIRQTFFQECAELLADLETGLMAMQSGDSDPETVNAVFRAVHSVKGGAGAFGLEDLVGFAHVFETTLDGLRSGKLAVTEPLMAVLLRSADLLSDLVTAAKEGGVSDLVRSEQLKTELRACSNQPAPQPVAAEPEPFAPVPDEMGFVPRAIALVDFDAPAAPVATVASASGWTVTFKPSAPLYAKGNDAVVLLRELAQLGHCKPALDATNLPGLDALEPEKSYLSWEIQVEADCAESAVREVFEFVDGDCELKVSPIAAQALLPVTAPVNGPLTAEVVPLRAAPLQAAPAAAPASTAPVSAAGQEQGKAAAAGASPTIRVDLERIDRLINLVGELVINQAMLSQRAAEGGFARSSNVGAGLDELEQLTREIQDSVMAIRAQPVKSVFQRMPRLVREVAAMTGKHVKLVTEGEGTEVDKTVIEQLTDPITHMIRNAIDHGLESPEKRAAAGKPAEGTVRLAAIHRSGRIVIEVSDDGAGINRPRVREIAESKGLIAPDAQLSDEELDNLIFLPGFSTAKEVSNVSGRGVGMDVVRRSIQGLGGRISIASQPGRGSVFTLSLPLTLAVLDGMVVCAGDQTLIIPLTAVVETLRPKSNEIHALGPNSHVVAIRDSHVPLVNIGRMVGARSPATNPAEGVCLLVETEQGSQAALLVDSIQGQRQVVIKSLEVNYQKVDLVAAATILGDGRVALILDVDAVISSSRGGGAHLMNSNQLQLAS